MSIAPPSDIVLDVAQAADPAQVRAAAARLAAIAGAPAADVDFTAVLQAHTKPIAAPPTAATVDKTALSFGRGHPLAAHADSPYRKFEAVVLQNFMQSMLPKDADLFGDSFSADAYRSMLAEQLAAQVAKSGRFGLAHAIEVREAATHPRGPGAEADRPAAAPPAPIKA